MRNKKQALIALAAIPAIALGWAAFRPERLFINKQVNEGLKIDRVLAQGEFSSGAHETKGIAEVVESGGKRVLRFDRFSTSNGPDVHVYLIRGTDSTQPGRDFIDLGEIKGNLGAQNYPLAADVDLMKFRSVAIWCKRFGVGFGGATLQEPTR